MLGRTVLLIAAYSLFAGSGNFCGITVTVRDARGFPASAVELELIDHTGRTIAQKRTDPDGRERFCDFPFGLHRILVGKGTCHPVEIRNVRLTYPVGQGFTVTLPDCDSDRRAIGCTAYIRVSSDRGQALESAIVSIDGLGNVERTDKYGRAFLALAQNDAVQLAVSAPGHERATFPISCSNLSRLEQSVVLKRIDRNSMPATQFCAISLLVTDDDLRPLSSIPIDLIGPGSRVIGRAQTGKDGWAQFCDLGFGNHRIRVGGDSCNSVEIGNVYLRYPKPLEFRVSLSDCADRGLHIGNACMAYFRVVAEKGDAVPFATVRQEGRDPSKADDFGRAIELIPFGRSSRITFTAPGFVAKTLSVECDPHGRTEKLVVLHPSKR